MCPCAAAHMSGVQPDASRQSTGTGSRNMGFFGIPSQTWMSSLAPPSISACKRQPRDQPAQILARDAAHAGSASPVEHKTLGSRRHTACGIGAEDGPQIHLGAPRVVPHRGDVEKGVRHPNLRIARHRSGLALSLNAGGRRRSTGVRPSHPRFLQHESLRKAKNPVFQNDRISIILALSVYGTQNRSP